MPFELFRMHLTRLVPARALLRSARLFVVATAVAATGCVQTDVARSGAASSAEREATARSLVTQGRYQEAADQYLQLAESVVGAKSDQFVLYAVAALVSAGDLDRSKALLAQRVSASSSRPTAQRRAVLLAEIGYAEQRPEDVIARLPPPLLGDAEAPVAARGLELRALALTQLGKPVAAARERVAMDFHLVDPGDLARNRRAIWNLISSLGPDALARAVIPPPDTLGGWIELALIAHHTVGNHREFSAGVATWQRRFPGHPANEDILLEIGELSSATARPPGTVALLLPFAGQFGAAAAAVRDGFLAAWYAKTPDKGGASRGERPKRLERLERLERPKLLVRDTTRDGPIRAYQQVIEDGAEFVVGPLQKSAVAALANLPDLKVPTLALNYVPGPRVAAAEGDPRPEVPAGLYQFGLSPEEEAELTAARAWRDGHEHAAVIVPEGTWGERVATAFARSWEQLGGTIVDAQVYPSDAKDMSKPVKTLLNIDPSIQRAKALRRVAGTAIKHVPRRRQDVDVIFMAGFPKQARQLRPQFDFHRAGEVAVYATSHVFTGTPNREADGDINGVRFGDMPWVLATGGSDSDPGALLRRDVAKVWPERIKAYVRLFAFGADAYDLITHLGALRSRPDTSFPGKTGTLSLDPGNRIARRLMWATFEDGIPRVSEVELGKP